MANNSDFDNTNRGALFVNNKKENTKHPDYTGNLNVDGQEFWLSAWEKQSKAGATFLSISITPKEAKPSTGFLGQAKAVPAPKPFGVDEVTGGTDEFDDNIPF